MIAASVNRIRHNYQRMKILKAINESRGVGREIEADELLEQCAAMGSPMVPPVLDYHLRYMAQRGWVVLQLGPNDERVDAVIAVTLTARGLDRIDIGKMPELEG